MDQTMPLDGVNHVATSKSSSHPTARRLLQVAFNVRMDELMCAPVSKADDFPLTRQRESDGEVVWK